MSTVKVCSHCGQEIKQARKEILNKHKLTMLQTAARHVMETGVNDFELSDLREDVDNYTNWQKLRYHGLVHHVRNTDGSFRRGHWLITRNGWAFLRGELDLSKWVKVRENSIVEHSIELVNVKEVYRGSDAITTTFEYFDEQSGQPVGFRPVRSPDRQLALV